MIPDEQPGKTLKDYIPSEGFAGGDISSRPPTPARPHDTTQGEASGGVFDQRGSGSSDDTDSSGGGKTPPNWVYLSSSGSPKVYSVSVGWGYLCERVPGSGEAIFNLEATNRLDGANLAVFTIEVGEAVYFVVEVDADGRVTSPVPVDPDPPLAAVRIEVGPDDEESTHYIPKVDDVTSFGAPGTYYYKLAALVAPVHPETEPTLEKWLMGSHISHFQELPAVKSTMVAGAGIGVIPQEWDNADKSYKLRAVTKGLGQANVTTLTDEVEVRGTKINGELEVYYGASPPSAEPFMEWQDGFHLTGTEVVGDEEEPPEVEPLNIFIPTVEDIGDGAQIKVTNLMPPGPLVDAGAREYLVRGNENDATFSISLNGGSPTTLFTCVDGLVPDETNNIDITIPDGAGMLPGDDTGDMLYWDGLEWVLLPTPGVPGSGNRWVLHHDGTAPSYVLYEEVAVDVCIAGVPTAYTILGIPTV